MTRALIIHRAGPGVTVQDQGRPGYLSFGLSRGGAADRLAVAEGAALLGQPDTHAALEMAGMGGSFEVTEPTRIALTGAPMRASIDGTPAVWNASHLLRPGERLEIGAATTGVYGYLHLGGGIDTVPVMGSRAAHLTARIGSPVDGGTRLPLGHDSSDRTGLTLNVDPRFDGGRIRLVPSLQTPLFAPEELSRFEATTFTRDPRGNRMGVRLPPEGPVFHTETGLNILSEIIVPGDIQITGDGTPFVLLCECGTTGGYPRIGTVIPADLPRIAQTRPGAKLRFTFIPLEEATAIETREAARRAGLRRATRPLLRDPRDIPDLLGYQLVSGVTAGHQD